MEAHISTKRFSEFRRVAKQAIYIIRSSGFTALVKKSQAYARFKLFPAFEVRVQTLGDKLRFLRPSFRDAFGHEPCFSIIIPIYDRTDLLEDAIRSALNQTFHDYEVILVLDGSPEETRKVVSKYRSNHKIRIFSYPISSGNAVRGRNKGVLEARGKYIAFLDSDDIADPRRLERSFKVLESGDADVVYGGYRIALDGSRTMEGLQDGQVIFNPDCDFEFLRTTCVPCQSTVSLRRSLLLNFGLLKPEMEYREDHELWLRLSYNGAKFKAINSVLTTLRLHSGNNELNFKSNDQHWAQKLEQEFFVRKPIPKRIGFIVAGTAISGGLAVILGHVRNLINHGHDAFIINLGIDDDISWYGDLDIPVILAKDFLQNYKLDLDIAVATFWKTVNFLETIRAKRKIYFVQSDERLFYNDDSTKENVSDTYKKEFEYFVVAHWIAKMLNHDFGIQQIDVVANGVNSEIFYPSAATDKIPYQRRPRILIEGPIGVDFKCVFEAYSAASALDVDVWLITSDRPAPTHWNLEKSFVNLDHRKMAEVYRDCDIFLKLSRVESFCLPALEAMACGVPVILGQVKGGIEYAQNGNNCLVVDQDDFEGVRKAITSVLTNDNLRRKLVTGGLKTANEWTWARSCEHMLSTLIR